ncbi:hypothetical protein [Flavobacterium sp. ZS1P14]
MTIANVEIRLDCTTPTSVNVTLYHSRVTVFVWFSSLLKAPDLLWG